MHPRIVLFSLLLLATSLTLNAQLCSEICTTTTSCDEPCYTCRFFYPDGYCPAEYTTWKTCGTYRGGVQTYDMVEWMVQTYSGHTSDYLGQSSGSGPISEFSNHDPSNRRFYRINGSDGNYNELFEYDDYYIYIRREASNVSGGAYLKHPGFVWTQRYVETGVSCGTLVGADSDYTRYSNCSVAGSGGPDFWMAVSGPETLNLGGDVGTVQALRLTQTNLSNTNTIERYYYAQPWGFVFYQKLVDGVVTAQETHNTKFSPAPPLTIPCGLPY